MCIDKWCTSGSFAEVKPLSSGGDWEDTEETPEV